MTQDGLSSGKISIYYDGLCRVCDREIEHYKKCEGSQNINFIDITQPGFNAKEHGLDPYQVNKYLHVKKDNGEILTGVDSFAEIWRTLPRYHWLSKVIEVKSVKAVAKVGYVIFASGIRPYLPKKIRNCETSPYCDLEKK